MVISKYFNKLKTELNLLLAIEQISLVYLLFTSIFIFIFFSRIDQSTQLLLTRLAIMAVGTLLVILNKYNSHKIFEVLRVMFPLALTAYWYPETYNLNNQVIFTSFDPFFDHLDVLIFHCRPALLFSDWLSQDWVSELMYFSYFFYYILFAFTSILFYFFDKKDQYRAPFIMLCSFLLFYLIFIFVPVAGPQFYFDDAACYVPDGYFFADLMRSIQAAGEKPTGAFPSSHVGMSLVFMMLIYHRSKLFFVLFCPIVLILFTSTVYIKAHYLVDVLGAFILTPIVYWLSEKSWQVLVRTKSN